MAALDLRGCTALTAVNLRNNDIASTAALVLGPAVQTLVVHHNPRLEVRRPSSDVVHSPLQCS